MGIYTNIIFLNANDPAFVKARDGTPEERAEWEDDEGPFDECPGARIGHKVGAVIETDEEYGGWIIPLATLPEGTTHIKVHRG